LSAHPEDEEFILINPSASSFSGRESPGQFT
jgi:hypothetical protein